MEDDIGGLVFSSVNTVSQQFSISTVSLTSEDESIENRIDTVTAANDLLENGILVETNKGLVCMSLKDALTSGVAGLNLSVEDFQNVAAQLLIQQNGEKVSTVEKTTTPLTLGDVVFNVLPDASQVFYKQIGSGLIETRPMPVPVGLQVEFVEQPHLTLSKRVVKKINKDRKNCEETQSEAKSNGTATSVSTAVVSLPNVVAKETSTTSTQATTSNQQLKKRGGWPKGRKRKPELLEMRPPKAPATGYVLYLNEKRKQYKDLPFSEVTKILGNEWSKLNLDGKRVYLERAEVEKKRYREELKAYRQSDAYQSYLIRKRIKNLQGNGTEESDMDATDEIEDEDNEELYCRTCDQWFSSLHNKKEHLYGRQHLQSIAGDFTKERLAAEQMGALSSTTSHSVSSSPDESSLDAAPLGSSGVKGIVRSRHPDECCGAGPPSVTDAISRFMETHAGRECEIKVLDRRLKDVQAVNMNLVKQLCRLKDKETKLQEDLESEREAEVVLEQQLYNLWSVPALFYMS